MSDKPPAGWVPDDSATEIGQAAARPADQSTAKTPANPFGDDEATVVPPPPRPTREDLASPRELPRADTRIDDPIQEMPTRVKRLQDDAALRVPDTDPGPDEQRPVTAIIPPLNVGLPQEPARWPWVAGGAIGVGAIVTIAWAMLSSPPPKVEVHAPIEVALAAAPPPAVPAPAPGATGPSGAAPAALAVLPPPAAAPPAPSPAPEPPAPAADLDQPGDELDIGGLINTARGNLLQKRMNRREKRKVSAQLEALNKKRVDAPDSKSKSRAEAALKSFIKKHRLD